MQGHHRPRFKQRRPAAPPALAAEAFRRSSSSIPTFNTVGRPVRPCPPHTHISSTTGHHRSAPVQRMHQAIDHSALHCMSQSNRTPCLCSLHAWSRSLCLGLWGGSEADKRLTVTASHRPARRPRTSPRRHHQYHRTQKPEYIHAARAPRRRSRRSIARVSFHVNPAGTPRSRARARETEGVGDRIDVTRRHLNWLGARRLRLQTVRFGSLLVTNLRSIIVKSGSRVEPYPYEHDPRITTGRTSQGPDNHGYLSMADPLLRGCDPAPPLGSAPLDAHRGSLPGGRRHREQPAGRYHTAPPPRAARSRAVTASDCDGGRELPCRAHSTAPARRRQPPCP
jgi:hypothetical protein